ncbi:NAD(P)H-dependent glycerol-3-phosphate dehydrogenase [Thiolapillus brandeum]|uniref:Glycerol-3-phosphate dehydrogenase [NAD(P)+] n=1 Tax=Thiolapillus brandeum TaxID=1076588 RepID=A0A7U6JGW8_9GAMM|nr:NAD(P)H-dependent glycerol-3-phosphate dehydrogenase [Thiolapillus brandeum]BAO43282.1 glycerol-3-phosphate dehydrogenase (NAD(P)+) [Thiolapillus brandeum]
MSGEGAGIAVLGAGSWGTALAILLARNGHEIRLWGHEPEPAAALQRDRENRHFLPGIPFPEGLTSSSDLAWCITDAEEILVVVPSHAFGSVMQQISTIAPNPASLSWATKGLEPESLRLLHEVARARFPDTDLAVVSGPTFALEVAKGMPTAITVASSNLQHATRMAGYLRNDTFRAYTSDDLVGVQIGGAAKNVMAIAAGMSDGLNFGANARAALITRGLAEITRLGLALGGQHDTFMGLAGLGDLVLTCTDNLSRNRRMGLALAEGLSIEEARERIGQEVEGLAAARDFRRKAETLNVDMPITEQVYRIIYEGVDPASAVKALLSREQKPEVG